WRRRRVQVRPPKKPGSYLRKRVSDRRRQMVGVTTEQLKNFGSNGVATEHTIPRRVWRFPREEAMADKIRLGLIGASVSGTWSSRSHLPALRASGDVELTAVCTTKADSAEAARRAWGARFAFGDWRQMITSPEIDAVAIVVRVPSHYTPT